MHKIKFSVFEESSEVRCVACKKIMNVEFLIAPSLNHIKCLGCGQEYYRYKDYSEGKILKHYYLAMNITNSHKLIL